MTAETTDAYWHGYSPLQEVKHQLIRSYLGAWFPIVASWARRVIYVDTHAGRGRHLSGALGSPLVALETLRGHKASAALRNCDFAFHLIEHDEGNFLRLREELAVQPPLPPNIHVEAHLGDAFEGLRALTGEFRREGTAAFVFVDPFGFKVPGSTLRELMETPGAELFVNVMWRPGLGLALAQEQVDPGMAALLTSFFDGEEWKTLADGEFDERADHAVDLLWRKIRARWMTSIRMRGVTKYLLVHFTNHDRGRDRMKEAMWKICPDGGFLVRQSDNPGQQFLLSLTPDLRPLRAALLAALAKSPKRWAELHELVRPTIWLEKHVNDVVRTLLKENAVTASDYRGHRPSVVSNPILTLR